MFEDGNGGSGSRENEPSLEDVKESIKLGFEAVKHLTTLTAGSIVVIATFLKDIFPSADGPSTLHPLLKVLVAASFVALGLSLVASAFCLWGFSVMPRSRKPWPVNKVRFRWYVAAPSFFYITGSMFFTAAVLIDLLALGSRGNVAVLGFFALCIVLLIYVFNKRLEIVGSGSTSS